MCSPIGQGAMRIRAGLVGCGKVARSHVEGYRSAGAEIISVADCNEKAAKELAEELGGVAVYSDYRRMFAETKPDAVSICTPPVAHEEQSIGALDLGIHVLCEKPLAFDVPSAQRIREAARRSDALLMPAFRHRFIPAIGLLREWVASGLLGDVVLFNNVFCGPMFGMEGTWFTRKAVAGGGSLLDTNSHSVDLFRFIVGEIASQQAVTHRHFGSTDVEDTGIIVVRSVDGALGALESSFVAGIGRAFVHITGTKGHAEYDYSGTEVRYRLTEDPSWVTQSVQESCGFREQINHFLGAARGEHPLSPTVDDGVRAMEVVCATY